MTKIEVGGRTIEIGRIIGMVESQPIYAEGGQRIHFIAVTEETAKKPKYWIGVEGAFAYASPCDSPNKIVSMRYGPTDVVRTASDAARALRAAMTELGWEEHND